MLNAKKSQQKPCQSTARGRTGPHAARPVGLGCSPNQDPVLGPSVPGLTPRKGLALEAIV